MTDKKITDDGEIIKRLEQCVKNKNRNYNTDIVLDLINRQKAENDCAKAKIKICAEVIDRQDKEIERLKGWEDVLKAEKHSLIKYTAYKEFAEKLKKELSAYRKKCRNALDNESVFVVDKVKQMLDILLKEMIGKK